jgi:Mg-chelatase subunit ChlD
MDLSLRVTKLPEGAGMATDPRSGDVLVDPRFFFEAGYTSPDQASYGILHETAAHVRTAVNNPRFNERVIAFAEKGDPQALFNNIFEDIAGNNLIHAVLPRMRGVARELYVERLFKETDYTSFPRHVQFLYKTIREEMAPGSEVTVLPEVDEALAGLRDYKGQGDVIKYSTAVAKSARKAMGEEERFTIWQNIIYPVYESLLEQDRNDPERQDQGQDQGQGQEGDGENTNDQGESQQSSGQPQEGSEGNTDQRSDDERFGSFYDDFKQNRHPEPMSEEEEEKLREHAKEKAEQQARSQSPGNPLSEQERQLDEKVRKETGHSLQEQRQYHAEITKWQTVIQEMRDVFQQVINDRVAEKRGLSRRNFAEGAVLDPDRLVQTVIDIRNNNEEPEAFRDYETKKGEAQAIGKTDYVFLFDISGSMEGSKADAAAASAVIGLEGLAALQRDVEEAEATQKVDLDLDIRTAIYVFGDRAVCVKPLSTKVSPKERLDTYAAVADPNDGSTQDYLALEEVEGWEVEPDRRRILIAVSDGGSNDGFNDTSPRARRAIDKLRGKGWFVYGISIGSDEAEALYKPTARRVDDPAKLPETIQGFIESTIT